MARSKKRKPGNLDDAKAVLWDTLVQAKSVLDKATEPDMQLKACHCVSQVCGQYIRVCASGEWEARLAALEAAVLP